MKPQGHPPPNPSCKSYHRPDRGASDNTIHHHHTQSHTMPFDRSKLTSKHSATPLDQFAASRNSYDKAPGSDYLKITREKTGWRLLPGHGGAHFAPVRAVNWLPFEREVDGETVVKRRPVSNSRVHLGTKSDIVEAYGQFITNNSDAFPNYEEIYDGILDSEYRPSGPKNECIETVESRMAYALQLDPENRDADGKPIPLKFGRLEIRNSIWKQLHEYGMDSDNFGGARSNDPYTDLDRGIYFFTAMREGRYKVTVRPEAYPVSDMYLEQFDKATPLADVLKYTQEDWDRQIEGIRLLDDKYDVGVLGSPEFKAILESVKADVFGKLSERNGEAPVAQVSEESEDDLVALARAEAKAFLKEVPEAKADLKVSRGDSSAEIRRKLEAARAKYAVAAGDDGDEEDDLFDN